MGVTVSNTISVLLLMPLLGNRQFLIVFLLQNMKFPVFGLGVQLMVGGGWVVYVETQDQQGLLPTLTDSLIMGPTQGISRLTLEYSDDSLGYLLGISGVSLMFIRGLL